MLYDIVLYDIVLYVIVLYVIVQGRQRPAGPVRRAERGALLGWEVGPRVTGLLEHC